MVKTCLHQFHTGKSQGSITMFPVPTVSERTGLRLSTEHLLTATRMHRSQPRVCLRIIQNLGAMCQKKPLPETPAWSLIKLNFWQIKLESILKLTIKRKERITTRALPRANCRPSDCAGNICRGHFFPWFHLTPYFCVSSSIAISNMNTNDPTLKPPKWSQDKTQYDSKRRDHPKKNPGVGWGQEWGGLLLPEAHQRRSPTSGCGVPHRMAGQTLTQIKPPQLPQQPEDERSPGHCDCQPTPGVCLSAQTSFLILQLMLTGRDLFVFISSFFGSKPSLSPILNGLPGSGMHDEIHWALFSWTLRGVCEQIGGGGRWWHGWTCT